MAILNNYYTQNFRFCFTPPPFFLQSPAFTPAESPLRPANPLFSRPFPSLSAPFPFRSVPSRLSLSHPFSRLRSRLRFLPYPSSTPFRRSFLFPSSPLPLPAFFFRTCGPAPPARIRPAGRGTPAPAHEPARKKTKNPPADSSAGSDKQRRSAYFAIRFSLMRAFLPVSLRR